MVVTIQIRLAKRQKERKTVGFYGVEHGVGTTCLAIAAANFAANEWGVPAAVAEMAAPGRIRDLDEEGECGDFFPLDGVDYYPEAKPARMPARTERSLSTTSL